jgi:hypothetical protein
MPTGPREPDSWRDWIRADYEYPEDFDELPRSQRRRAKRKWRREDRAQRMAWLRDERRSEPASPGGAVVGIVFLVIVVLGFGAALPRLLHGDEADRPPIGLLTPAPAPGTAPSAEGSQPPASTVPTESPTATSTAPSTAPLPPVATQRVSAADVAAAGRTAGLWARSFYTRNPAKESYSQLVEKAGRYTTREVSDSFIAAGDSTYTALRTAKGTSRVLAAPVTAPRSGTAPVDTPNRISRVVTVKIQVTGSKPAQLNLPLLVTLVPRESSWVISDVNGGAGT